MDRRTRFLRLLSLYDLHTGDVATLGERARYANHPVLADLKWRLEGEWLAELAASSAERGDLPEDPIDAMRVLAARDRLPEVYHWLAKTATSDEIVQFLALEGGPDGGFDDLVATCQVGLRGAPKLEMARNYWDEMGNGQLDRVHTQLHDDLATAIEMPPPNRNELPEEALERTALGGLFATNHWLQPEMIGALGLIELQAGPRCRLVLKGLERVGAPSGALPFYAEHADVDPVHGQGWLDNAITPYLAAHPELADRVLCGALWKSRINAAFFARVAADLAADSAAAA